MKKIPSKEEIEQKLREVYSQMDIKPLVEKCEWEEDGEKYSCWKINNGKSIAYTNDAGVAQLNEAMKEYVEKEIKKYDK